ncbi:hypothetical protein [Crenalkalicoccus roseus]|uniref:hypothetical protein n=1 Tax=Crenalkalicoccus roseus TaxID=1485588 RepID=UPI001080C9A2|nr:hypothetical protein [Crenalkalicoccus roseus]
MADGFLATLRRHVEDLHDTAEDYGHAASRRLRRTGRDTRRELRRLWSQLEDLVERDIAPRGRRYAHRIGDTARDYAEEGRERAIHAADYLRESARARPLLALGIATLATIAVISLLSRRR